MNCNTDYLTKGLTSTPNWKKTLLLADATLKDTIHNLDESKLQIALVVSENGILQGTITDGDIRRGLLRGLDMDSSVDSIIYPDPLVVPPEMDREMVLNLMRINKVHQVPIVNENHQVIGLHLWDEIDSRASRSNTMVIMAGGVGARLRPRTEKCPKPLLPVAGKPMLEHIIERAKVDGFEHFVLAIHYLGHMIEDYFGDGRNWQVTIEYLHEENPMGTAGALSLIQTSPTAPILVSNGDILTDVKYGEIVDFHQRQNALATMAVRLYEWQHPFGVVQTKGVEIQNLEEKPIYRTNVNAGVYVLEPEALDYLQENKHCDMPTLFERLLDAGKRVVAYPTHEPWLDVGRESDFEVANNNFKT